MDDVREGGRGEGRVELGGCRTVQTVATEVELGARVSGIGV